MDWPTPRTLRQRWALPLAVTVYLGATAWLLAKSVRLTNGHFSYALDDGYIHMSIARHLVQDGVWGIGPNEFAGAASSIVWPVCLAVLYLPGPWDSAPLVANVVFGILALALTERTLRVWIPRESAIAAVLLAAVLVTPLPTLTLEGMEHTLQTWSVLLLLVWGARDVVSTSVSGWRLPAAAALTTATRYEGAFAVLIIALLLVWRRRGTAAARVALGGAAPILVYGITSLAMGGSFLPNSVLIKAPSGWVSPSAEPLRFFLRDPLNLLLSNPHVLVLFAAALFLLLLRRETPKTFADARQPMLAAYLGLVYAQVTFARTGWGFRYEAYLVFIGVLVVALGLSQWPWRLRSREAVPQTFAAVVAAVFIITPLTLRADDAWEWTPWAQKNMYDQTHQVGHFLDRFYAGQSVVLVDVGAPTYFADVHVLDLAGLGSNEVAKLSPHHWLTPDQMRDLATKHGTKIAILGTTRPEIGGGLPSEWTLVGTWSIVHNVASGQVTEAFYAVDPQEREPLGEHLRAFARDLPPDVSQAGPFMNFSAT